MADGLASMMDDLDDLGGPEDEMAPTSDADGPDAAHDGAASSSSAQPKGNAPPKRAAKRERDAWMQQQG